MNGWVLGGLVLAMFIAGFNIGQDFKYNKWSFKQKKKYKYYVRGIYLIEGKIMFAGQIIIFGNKLTCEHLKEIKESEEKKMKDKYQTVDVTFGIAYIKELKG